MENIYRDIIMTGCVAEKGTGILASKYEHDGGDRIPGTVISRAKRIYRDETCHICERIIMEMHLTHYKVSEGGIYKALWDMAQAENVGVRVYLEDIYIRQETVELCEHYDINPYMLNGEGSFLIISGNSAMLKERFNDAGIHAQVIGYTCPDNDRIIINGDERRYIESHIKDELEVLL